MQITSEDICDLDHCMHGYMIGWSMCGEWQNQPQSADAGSHFFQANLSFSFLEIRWICRVWTWFYNLKLLEFTDCRKHECLEWCRQDVLISYLMENISCIWRHPQIQQGQPLNHCKATADWSACQSSLLSLLTNLNTTTSISPMSTHEWPLLENMSVIRATTLCQLNEEHDIV